MAEGGDQLIECWIYARSTYLLYLRLRIKWYSDALADFFFGLGNELRGYIRLGFGGYKREH